MINLDEKYINSMRELLGDGGANDYFAALNLPPVKGLRVNSLKISVNEFVNIFPYRLTPSTFSPDCFILDGGEKVGNTAFSAAGLFYSQEPSAAIAASALIPRLPPHARVLDLCAAPGGKTTALAAAMRGEGTLFANELVFSRAQILLGNVERMGISNCIVSSASPASFAEVLPSYFDAILVDAPCSGEGMLRKEDAAATNWSEKNVSSCAARASEILHSAAACLARGGFLLFSTCTFNTQENEQQVARFCEKENFSIVPIADPLRSACSHGIVQDANPETQNAIRVYPHLSAGEGHFACLMQKNGGEERRDIQDKKGARYANTATAPVLKEYYKLMQNISALSNFAVPKIISHEIIGGKTDSLTLLPEFAPLLPKLGILRAGVKVADIDGARLIPHHHLALAQPRFSTNSLDVPFDDIAVKKYLAGETLDCNLSGGYKIFSCNGFPLGLIKVSDGNAKNHYPKGLRTFI